MESLFRDEILTRPRRTFCQSEIVSVGHLMVGTWLTTLQKQREGLKAALVK